MEDKIKSIFGKEKKEGEESLKTSEEVMEDARKKLEMFLESGVRSITFIAERLDGFDFCSSPSSIFTVIGATKSVYDLFNEKGNTS